MLSLNMNVLRRFKMKSCYVKTLLYAYPNIHKIINRIDDIVNKKAMESMNDFSDCKEQCENIIKLTAQKGILFEIKYYLDKILSRLLDEEREYIEFKYFKRKKREEFKDVDLSSRNYFRKQVKLFEYICSCFEWLNLTDEWFENKCERIPYVKKLLQSVLLKQNTVNSGNKLKNSKKS